MHQYPGKLIVVEGPDLSGKTTQRDKIAEDLKRLGVEVVISREPGGTPFAEKIRDLCKLPLDGEPKHSMTELLLNYASRHQHLQEVIIPALKRGAVVVCDRYHLSSGVFQCMAGTVSWNDFEKINDIVVGDVVPDLTFVFIASPETCTERLRIRREVDGNTTPDHFDDKEEEFLNKVRDGYGEISRGALKVDYTGPIVTIDANGTVDDVFDLVKPHLVKLSETFTPLHLGRGMTKHFTSVEDRPYVMCLRGTTVETESDSELFRVTVAYQNGASFNVISIDDNDRVHLHPEAVGSYPASQLEAIVNRVVDCLSIQQRDGILELYVQKYPFGKTCPPHSVSVIKEFKI